MNLEPPAQFLESKPKPFQLCLESENGKSSFRVFLEQRGGTKRLLPFISSDVSSNCYRISSSDKTSSNSATLYIESGMADNVVASNSIVVDNVPHQVKISYEIELASSESKQFASSSSGMNLFYKYVRNDSRNIEKTASFLWNTRYSGRFY